MTGPKYCKDRAILRPNVEMNCNDIFMRHISGAREMLKSLRNYRQSQQPTRRNGGLLRADAERNSLSWSLNRLQLSLYQQAGGSRSKYNYWRRKGLTEQ